MEGGSLLIEGLIRCLMESAWNDSFCRGSVGDEDGNMSGKSEEREVRAG
jgi:hypothetical protein